MSFVDGQHVPLLPFPSLAETFAKRYSTGELALRPFGLYESDLNVNFNRAARPLLVTDILRCCTTRSARACEVEPPFFWELTVGKRIECLLSILSSGTGGAIPLAFRCLNNSCGQELETEISLSELSAVQTEAYFAEQIPIRFETASFALRRPTANDQLEWLKSEFKDEEARTKAMLRTLLLSEAETLAFDEDESFKELFQLVDEAMDEHDPLINFSLRAVCPYCEEENSYEIDLEGLALHRLRRKQLRLLASVHQLAAHYHWSEQQIFSVPFWRRSYYLSLIEKEKEQ